MAENNKIIYNGEVLIDLTEDTVDPSRLLKGFTAHQRNGARIMGQAAPVFSVNDIKPDDEGNVLLTLNDLGGDLTQYVKKIEAPGYSDILTNAAANSATGYVRKVPGSRLMTEGEANKLLHIEDNAQRNVQSDFLETDENSDAYIKNVSALNGKLNFLPLSGGRMQGAINMNSNRVYNLLDAIDVTEPTTLRQLNAVDKKKQDNIRGVEGQYVVIDRTGRPVAQDPPVTGVSSVNGYQGDVQLNWEDVRALPDTTHIPVNSDFTLAGLSERSYRSLTDVPTKLSQFQNDPKYITRASDIDGNAATATRAEIAQKDSEGHDIVTTYLKLIGGLMRGSIDMGQHKILNVTAGTLDGDAVNKKQLEDAIKSLGTVLVFVGVVPKVTDLPLSGNKKGDVWIVEETGSEYVWTSNSSDGSLDDWHAFGPPLDLSVFLRIDALSDSTGDSTETTMTQKAITEYLGTKQAVLEGTPGSFLVYNSSGKVDETTLDSVGVTGVKGSEETEYRKGLVELDYQDVGALGLYDTAVDSLLFDGYRTTDFIRTKNMTKQPDLSLVTHDKNGIIISSDPVYAITNETIDTLWG